MKAEGLLPLSKEPHHLSSSQNKLIQFTPRHCIQSIPSTFILIFSPTYTFSFKMPCLCQRFSLNSPSISLFNPTCHMPYPSHLPLFYYHNYMCWEIKLMNSTWLKFFNFLLPPPPLRPKFSSQHTWNNFRISLSDGYQSQSVKTKNFLYSHIRLSFTFTLHVEGFRGLRPQK
jgi:hypothetical protein